MIEGLLGKKIGMSRWFAPDGEAMGVTLIKCGPCYVVESGGDGSLQIAFDEVKEKNLSRAESGHLKKNGVPPMRHLRVVKWLGDTNEAPGSGDKLGPGVFSTGEYVDLQGVSKGKGFTGVVKRWGFSGGRKTHGSTTHREPGAIGAGSDPSRVWPGKKMAGRSGGKTVTVFNLEVVNIDPDENILAVRGAVPGANGSLVFIRRTLKKKVSSAEGKKQ